MCCVTHPVDDLILTKCFLSVLQWAGCRAACDFHFPYGTLGSSGSSSGDADWSLRPTSDASSAPPPRVLPQPRFDSDGLVVRWRHPHTHPHPHAHPRSNPRAAVPATSSPAPAPEHSGETHTTDSAEADGEASDERRAEDTTSQTTVAPSSRSPQPTPAPAVVYIVSAKVAPSMTWKELTQVYVSRRRIDHKRFHPARSTFKLVVDYNMASDRGVILLWSIA